MPSSKHHIIRLHVFSLPIAKDITPSPYGYVLFVHLATALPPTLHAEQQSMLAAQHFKLAHKHGQIFNTIILTKLGAILDLKPNGPWESTFLTNVPPYWMREVLHEVLAGQRRWQSPWT